MTLNALSLLRFSPFATHLSAFFTLCIILHLPLLPSSGANILWRWMLSDLHPFPTRPVVACPLANLVIIFIFISFFSLAGQLFSNSCCFFTVFSSSVSSSFSILLPLSFLGLSFVLSFFLFALTSVLSPPLSLVLFHSLVASLASTFLGPLFFLSFFSPLLSPRAPRLPRRASEFGHERSMLTGMLTGGCRMRHARQGRGRNAGVREHARSERVGAVRVSEGASRASGWKECWSPGVRERAYGRRRRGGEGGGGRARLEGQEYVLVYEAGETDVPCIIERSPGLWSPAAAAIHLQAMLA